MQFIFIP